MSQHPPDPVIITHPPGYALLRVVAAVAAALGIAAAVYYAWAGLTLSHYDAKGHLVVARRIADSLTPGWVQLGAVWLPLPHLINLVPTQVDFFYRTGAFSVGVSILSFTITAYLVARIVFETTGSALGAVAAAAVPVLNPDVLYLQSTPMTEPLLMALAAAAAFFTVRAIQDDSPARTRLAGWVVAAAFLTRYEAWPITAALVGLSLVVLLWQRRPLPVSLRRVAAIAVYPAGAALAFAVLSRATVGEWFVKSGFFVPENVAQGRPLRALVSVWWGVHELTSYPLALLAVCGVLMLVVTVCVRRDRASWVLPLALAGAAALPAYAFYNGHPFRIRYMIPLVPVVGLGLGYFVGLAGRARALAAAIALVAIVLGPRPFDSRSPMVLEAQWDRDHRMGREQVTTYLRQHWDGQPIMASMGSLAHYMQELSSHGFAIRDFLHEGNGDIWLAALDAPAPHAAWMLMEEQAEGGDMLTELARTRPRFLDGYLRVAEGGGVALYRRRP